MKFAKLIYLLVLGAWLVDGHAESPWDEALRVDSTAALEAYWEFSSPPSTEAQMNLLRAGGTDNLNLVLEILVQEDGTVAARVIEASGNDAYDQAAILATEEFEYEPAAGNEQRRPVVAPFEWDHGR